MLLQPQIEQQNSITLDVDTVYLGREKNSHGQSFFSFTISVGLGLILQPTMIIESHVLSLDCLDCS